MKHYAKMNGYELDQLNPRYRRCYGGSAESLAETKRIYRGRERAALSRMVDELVVEELEAMTREFKKRELRDEMDARIDEFEELMDYIEWCDEVEYEGDDYWLALSALRTARKRADAAYIEWFTY